MGRTTVDDLIDEDEVPEWTEEDFANAIPFDQLPKAEKRVLREIMAGNVTFRPDPEKKPVTMALSSDALERFTATGEGGVAGGCGPAAVTGRASATHRAREGELAVIFESVR